MELLHFLISFNLIVVCILIFIVDNPVHSVLCLILAFFNAAIILFLFDVEFLGIVFIVIYVGAIAILFLFVVMMLNVKIYFMDLTNYYLLLLPLFIIFSIQILILVLKTFLYFETHFKVPFFIFDSLSNLSILGQVLFNYYNSCFLLSGLVLLVAMIGAISLTLNFTSKRKSELLFKQLSRLQNLKD